jgi:predicted nucleotidyltransferase
MVQREGALTKDQVAERLAAHAEELRSLGVRSLDLFGSVARGMPGRKVMWTCTWNSTRCPGSSGTSASATGSMLGRHVDLVMVSGLHPRLRERVLREARHLA